MTSYLDDLERLRVLSVDHRRRLVRDLAASGERGGAQDLRELFLKVQVTIEAIDRALADEKALAVVSRAA